MGATQNLTNPNFVIIGKTKTSSTSKMRKILATK